MRPVVLFPLFADVTALPGIGPRFGKLIAKLAGPKADELLRLEPVYPMTTGLPAGTLRKAVEIAVERAPELPEWLDRPLKERRQWPGWRQAIVTLHSPAGRGDLEPTAPARLRLAYDE